jgi:hypothetical protein
MYNYRRKTLDDGTEVQSINANNYVHDSLRRAKIHFLIPCRPSGDW